MIQVFTSVYDAMKQITIPIAHGKGNYYCDEATLNNYKITIKLFLHIHQKIRTEVLQTLLVLSMKREMCSE